MLRCCLWTSKRNVVFIELLVLNPVERREHGKQRSGLRKEEDIVGQSLTCEFVLDYVGIVGVMSASCI